MLSAIDDLGSPIRAFRPFSERTRSRKMEKLRSLPSRERDESLINDRSVIGTTARRRVGRSFLFLAALYISVYIADLYIYLASRVIYAIHFSLRKYRIPLGERRTIFSRFPRERTPRGNRREKPAFSFSFFSPPPFCFLFSPFVQVSGQLYLYFVFI